MSLIDKSRHSGINWVLAIHNNLVKVNAANATCRPAHLTMSGGDDAKHFSHALELVCER